MVRLTLDGRTIEARSGQTILEAALANGMDIPRLCHDPRLIPSGACRLCQVHVGGTEREPVLACCTAVTEGATVVTESPELASRRRAILELLLSEHRMSCATCDADGDCALQDLAYRYGATEWAYGTFQHTEPAILNYTSENRGIEYDVEKCIRCGRCVRFCDEVQGACALTFDGRGITMKVNTAHGRALHQSDCELCGGCIRLCPTGAMREKTARGMGRLKDLTKVQTTCTYCGVGCTFELNVNPRLNRVVRVTTQPGMGINDGNLCVKGHFAFDFIHSPERLRKPLIREHGAFREASWEEAIEKAGRALVAARDRYGPEGLAFLSSSRCTNEENYLMQKLARAAGRTNNIDQCATTCHAPTVAGLALSLGSGAMTNSISEIKHVQTLFVIGANPTEAHPIVGLEMKKAMRNGARLIVCDPRDTWMAKHAHLHIKHRHGTDNMLINAMMHHILARGLHDRPFVADRCEQFEALRENVRSYTPELAAEVCGVEAGLIRRAAEWYAAGTPSAIFYTLGITEHTCGTENVQNLANLAMLCGQIGKESSGINPIRGQNNVQGACDVGAIHSVLPGYQKVADAAVRAAFAKAWGVELPTHPGGRVTDFLEKAGEGVLKAFYVFGEDPVLSEPNQARVVENLKKLDFLVVQEIFMSETAMLADVVLPATCFAEKDGTFTNTERRVQRVRKAVEPPGEARQDWRILCDMSTAMGYPMSYGHPSEIWDELASLTPSLAGISYTRIDKMGLQWPCPTPDHPGTAFLHQGRFTRGKGLMHAIAFRPPAEQPDADYPFVLSTGRTLYHYNIGNMTRKTAPIAQKQNANFVEMHDADAERLGIVDGGAVRVTTRRGSISVRARVSGKVRPGALWMPFHFAESSTNRLTHDAFDNITRTAEYKCCAATIEPDGHPDAPTGEPPR
ncbi:MAG: formate dehydrogenase subunit alpha [Lentisphaerae bacterium RIFOXYC12_FULL_60_16]|nr:MAG: formate dehydrogenase subunit alpha [Lentisphaerae bacterium RIFOXYC12_FULL_60_16]